MKDRRKVGLIRKYGVDRIYSFSHSSVETKALTKRARNFQTLNKLKLFISSSSIIE